MNNEIPQPVDVNKLATILGNARKIMKATESGNYKSGNIDSSLLVQDTNNYVNESNVSSDMIPQGSNYNSGRQINNYSEDTIKNSRLPESIKRAMLENPIPMSNNLNHTFNLEDVSGLLDEKPMPAPSVSKNKRVVTENIQNNGDMITISQSQLKDMFKDVLIEYLSNEYSKNLTETVIKKTINSLIKEGKINVKK
jgi:hypothetical protein